MSIRFSRRVVVACLVATLLEPIAGLLGAGGAAIARVSPELTLRQGCMNQWLFNGIWRVRVIGVAIHTSAASGQQDGWLVSEEWRNGTDRELTPGPDTYTKPQSIVLAGGQSISTQDSTSAGLTQSKVDYQAFPPSGSFHYDQLFMPATPFDAANKPAELHIAFDSAKLAQLATHPQFTVNPADYRVKLTCAAAANSGHESLAQGGSSQVRAKDGCLDQWMSNGVWRMRVTGLAAYAQGDSGKQIGWVVSEDWVNAAGRKLMPLESFIADQQLALRNGDTIASSNTTQSELSAQELVLHEFSPGATFSYRQKFLLYSTADAADKPVKLLVLFDAKNLRDHPNSPQFATDLSNYRIRFDCSG